MQEGWMQRLCCHSLLDSIWPSPMGSATVLQPHLLFANWPIKVKNTFKLEEKRTKYRVQRCQLILVAWSLIYFSINKGKHTWWRSNQSMLELVSAASSSEASMDWGTDLTAKRNTSFPFIWIKEKAGFFGGKFVEPLVLDITSSNPPSVVLAFRCLYSNKDSV